MKRIRLTRKDRDAVYEAIDFITTNTDGVESSKDSKYYSNMTRRLNRIWRKLNELTHRKP